VCLNEILSVLVKNLKILSKFDIYQGIIVANCGYFFDKFHIFNGVA